MARNTVRSQCQAVYVSTVATGDHFVSGNSGANLVTQLYRMQSFDCGLTINRTDVNEIDKLARIDAIITEPPEVTASINYLSTNMLNESRLGMVVDGTCSCISGYLTKTTDERNLFFLQVPEGNDAAGYAGASSTQACFAVGNAFVSNYTVNGAVGSIPNVSVDFVGNNFRIYNGSTGQPIPAVNPSNGVDIAGKIFSLPAATTGVAGQLSALLPGDITLDLGSSILGIDLGDAKIQDFSLTIPLSRENLNKLGTKFAFSKELQFPLTVSLTVNGNAGDLTTGSLSQVLCQDQTYDNLTINMRRPTCDGSQANVQNRYVLKGAKLTSRQMGNTVNGLETFSATWETQVGASQDLAVGIFMSGALV